MKLFSLLGQGWAYFRSHTLQQTLGAILSQDAHPLIQFCKYGCCGVLALVTQLAFFNLFCLWFPTNIASGLSDDARSTNLAIANLLAFPFSNLAAYFSNRIFVFKPGRHSASKEFAIFTAISLLSFGVGLAVGIILIPKYGLDKWAAEGTFVLTSALVNFVCRKFFVFAK